KLLAFLGQLPRVDAAAFHPNHGNVARWAGVSRTTRTADTGFHVSRTAFDRVLRAAAAAAGAAVVHGIVRRVEVGTSAHVEYASAAGVAAIRARLVLDCSGRAGVVARRGWRRADAHYRTLAIAVEYDCAGWPEAERTQTLVESYGDGWAWRVPLSPVRRQCTVMVEAASSRRRGESSGERYARELAKTTELRARLAGATQVGAAWTCDASIYDSTRASDDGVLLVGDAA